MTRWLLVLGLLGAGWRVDGSGRAPNADPPAQWGERATPVWSVDTTPGGASTPVVLGDLLCFTQEPTTARCVKAATGDTAWSHDFTVLQALPESSRPPIQEVLDAAADAQNALATTRGAYSKAQRQLRADPSPENIERVGTLAATLETHLAAIEAARPYLTPAPSDGLGWSTPSVTTDGDHLYVQFANGVVAALNGEGQVLWQRWLGPSTTPLKGYAGRPTASPQRLSEGLLLAYNTLQLLDPATGQIRWTSVPYGDYGTPTVHDGLVYTPSGDVVRLADGGVVAERLALIHYAAPVVLGDRIWWIGTLSYTNDPSHPARAVAWRREGPPDAPTFAQHTRAVRLVDDQIRVIPLGAVG